MKRGEREREREKMDSAEAVIGSSTGECGAERAKAAEAHQREPGHEERRAARTVLGAINTLRRRQETKQRWWHHGPGAAALAPPGETAEKKHKLPPERPPQSKMYTGMWR